MASNVRGLYLILFFLLSWVSFGFGAWLGENLASTFYSDNLITALLKDSIFAGTIGLGVGLAQGLVLYLYLSKFNFMKWLLFNILGFAIGGVLGVFSAGFMTALMVTLAQFLVLQPYLKGNKSWFPIMLFTTIICGSVFTFVFMLSALASASIGRIPIAAIGFVGLLYALGTTCAASQLSIKQSTIDEKEK
jgi:hypothetical protein